jgi:hypothetical protein
MKKSALIFVLVVLAYQFGSAQVGQGYLRIGTLGQVITPKTNAANALGAVYMDTSWRKANITLYNSDQTIQNILTKYELRSNQLEVLIDGEIKVLDPKSVKSMVYYGRFDQPHNFVNGKDLTLDGAPYRGLLEVIFQGKISVYKQYSYYIQPSNKNTALSTGTRDETIQNENHIYYAVGTELNKFPKRKKMLELFGDKMQVMQKFIKDNDLNTSNEGHLAKIFEHYNSL